MPNIKSKVAYTHQHIIFNLLPFIPKLEPPSAILSRQPTAKPRQFPHLTRFLTKKKKKRDWEFRALLG